MTDELIRLIEESKKRVAAMTPQQLAEMREAQRASYVRAMTTPCEHGVLDFEQCTDCKEHKA